MKKLGKAVHICSTDRALKLPADDATPQQVAEFKAAYERACETGDLTGLPTRGRPPVLWRLQSLSLHGWEEISNETTHSFRLCRMALQRGLVSMEHAAEELKLERESDGTEKILTYETMEAIFEAYGKDAIVELGLRVMRLSNLPPPSGQG